MKKIKLYIIFSFPLLFLFPLNIGAQTIVDWDTSGATWVYKMTTISEYHYYKLQMEGDTIIDGQNAKKIRVTQFFIYGYGATSSQGPETYVKTEYLKKSNDAIYRYQDGVFVFLYNFNAQEEDSWILTENMDYSCLNLILPPTDTVLVTTKGVENINGIDFEVTTVTSGTYWYLGEKIISGIGPRTSPFPLPTPGICNVIDEGVGNYESLSCYYNDAVGHIQFNGATFSQCVGFVTNSEDVSAETNQVQAFPNPTKGIFHLVENGMSGNIDVHIYDLMGKLCFSENNTQERIDIRHLLNGVYFVSVFADDNLIKTFKILKI